MLDNRFILDKLTKTLNNNGVIVNINNVISEIASEKDFDISRKIIGCDVDLNFDEHDEKYKAKIRSLEDEIRQLKHDIDKMAKGKSEWIDRAVEWQQKYEKLQSEMPSESNSININDFIKVKLTPYGAEIYYHQLDELHEKCPSTKNSVPSKMPCIDEEGYTRFQLHQFMNLYGEYAINGGKPFISPMNLIIDKGEQK